MKTEVIILAQGTQQRLGMQHGYKQLLPLPACGGAPILVRTMHQIGALGGNRANYLATATTIITWHELHIAVPARWYAVLSSPGRICMQLKEPGNSSLKGLSRYLEQQPRDRGADATIVLLGDVVYSWACLKALFALPEAPGWGFVGTHDLSGSAGELWGVAWNSAHEDTMMADLRDAMLRHPPFEDDYQPGQLRRWITGWRRGDLVDHVRALRRRDAYIDIDDYTMDVDLPHQIPALAGASALAAADDLQHGLTWEAP